ncbi:NUDIX domain-containing protein [Actinocatenispora rupis]|uniref:NUDIX hydrolase n=1 Tax=Actinocatenispora rupis TaxID=519421 RepID=A0A8J3NAD5_9ACTN|nr:NUDIX hydrolase [Actinocatenispora rupis]GID11991.1 NUDIX hydrolase [Actinocatenispora rupis]
MTSTDAGYEVLAHREQPVNKVFRLVSDDVRMPDGAVATRDYLGHTGAVAAVCVDPDGRVLLLRQYRHPVGRTMWELPAGLTDEPGEKPVDAARRELAEEADLTADRWDLLLDLHTTPGCSDELIHVYLARDVAEVPAAERHQRVAEEAGLTTSWVPLDDAVRMVLAGEITNATCVAGVLAAARGRDTGWADLRPVD